MMKTLILSLLLLGAIMVRDEETDQTERTSRTKRRAHGIDSVSNWYKDHSDSLQKIKEDSVSKATKRPR